MQSTASSVGTYIAQQPPAWRATLARLRTLCRRELPGYVEEMAYGMPSYARTGKTEVAFAQQAHYLSLYILKQPVLDRHRPRLAGLRLGKGCIRYRRPDQIDWEVVASLLAETRTSEADICSGAAL
jgi:uncharacterized protein YdhG (YjbR/CyaY superfamily)